MLHGFWFNVLSVSKWNGVFFLHFFFSFSFLILSVAWLLTRAHNYTMKHAFEIIGRNL